MAIYKGKYFKESDDTWTVELYKDDTLKEVHKKVPSANDAKACIIPWFASEGGTKEGVNSDNFTPDMDNFDSLYVKT